MEPHMGRQAHRPRAIRDMLTRGPQTPHVAQPGVTLTCWLNTTGPESHEALCVHRCCQTHQLHPQRLLTQAWHLHRAQPWGTGTMEASQGSPGPGGQGEGLTVQTGGGQ